MNNFSWANITKKTILLPDESFWNMKVLKPLIITLFSGLTLIISTFTYAQSIKVKDSTISISLIHIHYAFMAPGGDMKTRFGNTINVGTGFLRKTKSNLLWGAEMNFLAGNDVKEKYIFDSLKTIRGQYITTDGNYGDVRISERGFNGYVHAGKVFPVFGSNKNSGIMVLGGVGFMQHQIHVEVLEENVPSLNGDYRKGYDRLTNGISLQEFLGYLYISEKLRLNFIAGFEFSQSFTKNRRDWDYFAQRKLDESRKDYLSGIKIGLVLPLYQRKPREFYYR